MAFWIVLGVLVAALGWGVVLYNRLVRLRNRSENAWSDVDVQLKRRHELIPNLVETVRGYAGHERETFERVTAARTRAEAAADPRELAAAEGELTRGLRQLFAVAEGYPELRASESFLALQQQLAAVEDALQNARRYYNAVVRDLNDACETVPSTWVAGAFGFDRGEYFELDDDAERAAPQVRFA